MASLFRAYSHLLEKHRYTITSITSGCCYGLGDQLAQYIEIKTGKRTVIDYHRTSVMTLFGFGVGGPLYTIWFKKIHHINVMYESLAKWNYERQLRGLLINSFAKHIKAGTIDKMSMAEFRRIHETNFSKLMNGDKMVFRSKTIMAGQLIADQFIFSAIYPVIFIMTTGILLDNTTMADFKFIKDNKTINIDKIIKSIDDNWKNVKDKYIGIYTADLTVWPMIQVVNFAFVPEIYQPIVVNFCNIFWNAFLCYTSHAH